MAYANDRLHRIYQDMKTRCYNPNYDKTKWYYDKGITICDEWLNSFEVFRNWALRSGYKDDLTIDRIDANDNYRPGNCRWVTRKEQANNRTSNRLIEFNGQVKTMQGWADSLGIDSRTLWARLRNWPLERALTEKTHSEFGRKEVTWNGETHSVWEWGRILGIKPSTLSARLNRSGWPLDRVFTTPVGGKS